jgi:hypothetical protein
MHRIETTHRLPRCGGRHPWAVLLISLGLVGCQSAEPPQQVEAPDSAIRFQHADFRPELAEYFVQREPVIGNRTHWAKFQGSQSLGVVVAVITGPTYVVEEGRLERRVSSLVAEDVEIAWGDSGGTALPGMGYVPYRLFDIASEGLGCVGFSQTGGETMDDRGRKSGLVFGYFCRTGSQPMATARAEELIGTVRIVRDK